MLLQYNADKVLMLKHLMNCCEIQEKLDLVLLLLLRLHDDKSFEWWRGVPVL